MVILVICFSDWVLFIMAMKWHRDSSGHQKFKEEEAEMVVKMKACGVR